MNKTLELKFLDAEGKSKTLTIREPKENLDETTIRQSMQSILEQALFAREGIQQYVQIHSARYVDRQISTLFDDSLI